MPTSHFNQLSKVVEIIFRLRPTSILDIGIGCGKYGILAREYLDRPFEERRVQIDGIEGFAPYVKEGQRYYYDSIYIGNALDLLPGLGQYDLILIIDVLEHFTREDGLAILTLSRQKAKHVLISTPLDISVQGPAYGNEYETHRFQWTKRHLKAFGPVTFFRVYQSLFCVLGPDGGKIKRIMRWTNFKLWLRSFFPALYRAYVKVRYRR